MRLPMRSLYGRRNRNQIVVAWLMLSSMTLVFFVYKCTKRAEQSRYRADDIDQNRR